MARRNLRRANRNEAEGDDHSDSDSGSDEEYSENELKESIETSEEEESKGLGSNEQKAKANSVPHFLPYISFSNSLPTNHVLNDIDIDDSDSYTRRNLSENDLQSKRVPLMYQATAKFGSFSLFRLNYANLAIPDLVVPRKAKDDDEDENEDVGADILDSPLDSPVRTSFATLPAEAPQEIAEFNPEQQQNLAVIDSAKSAEVSAEVHDEMIDTIQQIMNNTVVDTPISIGDSNSDSAKIWPTEEATEINDFDAPTLNIDTTSNAQYSSSQDLYGSVKTDDNVVNANVPVPAVKRKRGANIERNVEIFEAIIAQNPPGECDESTRPGVFGKLRNIRAFNYPEVENGIDFKVFDNPLEIPIVSNEDGGIDMQSIHTPEDKSIENGSLSYSQTTDGIDAGIEQLNSSTVSVIFENTANDLEHPLYPLLMTRMLNNSPNESQDAIKGEEQGSDELADNENGHVDNEAKHSGAGEEEGEHNDEGEGQEQQQQGNSDNAQTVQGGNGDGDGDDSDDEGDEGDESDSSEDAEENEDEEDEDKDKESETKIDETPEYESDQLITTNGSVPQVNDETETAGNEHSILLSDIHVDESNLIGSSQLRTSHSNIEEHEENANTTEQGEIVPQVVQIGIPVDETAQATGNQILTLTPNNVEPQVNCQLSLSSPTSAPEPTEDQLVSSISNASDASVSNESINSAASNNPQTQTITVTNDNEPVDISLVNRNVADDEEFDSPTLLMPRSSSVVEPVSNNLVASNAGLDDINVNDEEFNSPTLSMPRSSQVDEPVSNNIPNACNADEVNFGYNPNDEAFDSPTLVIPRSSAPQLIIEPAEPNPSSAQQAAAIGGEGGDDDGDDDNGDSLNSASDNGVNISKAPKQPLDQNERGIGVNLLNMLNYGFIPSSGESSVCNSSGESSEYSSSDESTVSSKSVQKQVAMLYPAKSSKSKKNKLPKKSDRRIVDTHSSTVLQSNYFEILGGAESSPSLASTSELNSKTVESGDFGVIVTIVVISALSLAALGYIAKKFLARKKAGIDLEVEGRRN